MIRTRSQLARSSEPPLEPSNTSLEAASSSVTTRQTFSSLPASRSVRNKPQEPSTALNRHKETYLPVQLTNRVVQEEEDESQDEGEEMLKWGYILLVGSPLTPPLGIWTIAIGPYVDTTGLGVSITPVSLPS